MGGCSALFYQSFLLVRWLIAGCRRNRIRRYFVYRLSEMGSAIIADRLWGNYGQKGAELFFVIFSKTTKASRYHQNHSGGSCFFKMRRIISFRLLECISFPGLRCRRKKISTVIDLELFSRFTALLSPSAAQDQVGFTSHHDEGLYRGNLVNKKSSLQPTCSCSGEFRFTGE